jgi:antitoxin component of MazEF toxin-antitoxin module
MSVAMGKKYVRKISKMGNSYGISIPTEFIKENKISLEDEFVWTEGDNGEIYAKPVEKPKIRREVLDLFSDIIEEDEDLLRALRDK